MSDTVTTVLRAADHLIAAFGSHDAQAYFAAFDPEASFIFYNLDRILRSRAEYEAEWALWESRDGFRVLSCRSSDRQVQLLNDAAIFTHVVETELSLQGDKVTNRERETIVFKRTENGAWSAVHEHLSALP